MKIEAAGTRMFLNRSAKNLDGGWTKGEMEFSLQASLEEGDCPKESLQKLKEIIRGELYKSFKVNGNVDAKQREALKNWGRKQEL
ncbi:MAG: hypothetical protein KAS36_09370 [Anaerolineales bacterium]|jgi:hypothetical protein|nr:hypothetical protein [Anaerolineales bacterium]